MINNELQRSPSGGIKSNRLCIREYRTNISNGGKSKGTGRDSVKSKVVKAR